MKIASVVVLYNPNDEVVNNIETYLKDVDALFVVDNSDNDNEKILPKSKKIKYIANHNNLGIAKALNQGCQMAIDENYKWILTMDQDSHWEGNNLKILINDLKKMDMKNIAIVSPYQQTKLNEPMSPEKYDNPVGVITSGNLVNLEIYQKIGGFKEWLFIDGVDIEYCLNARKNGYIILRDNKSIMQHNLGDIFYGKIFGRQIICTNHNYIRRYYIMRNDNYIYDMYKDFDPIYSQSTKSQKDAILGIIFFEKGKIKKLWYSLRGYIDYKKGVKGKIKK